MYENLRLEIYICEQLELERIELIKELPELEEEIFEYFYKIENQLGCFTPDVFNYSIQKELRAANTERQKQGVCEFNIFIWLKNKIVKLLKFRYNSTKE